MFLQSTAVMLALVGVVLANQSIDQITHKNGDQLVSTGHSNYGLSSRLFSSLKWRTVSVNGNEVTLYLSDFCHPSKVSMKSLDAEKVRLIQEARQQLVSRRGEFIDVTYQNNGNCLDSERMSTWNVTMAKVGDFILNKFSDSVYSVKYWNFPNGINRVLFAGETVTFVYTSNKVQTKPIVCLESEEKELIETIQSTVKQHS